MIIERGNEGVPSLYVRVYHPGGFIMFYVMSSLTIREGISGFALGSDGVGRFPHYT